MHTLFSPALSEPRHRRRRQLLGAALAAALLPLAPLARAAAPSANGVLTLVFRGTGFTHRWSKDGQHEFTPQDQADLATWRDMLTLNQHPAVVQGEQLAQVANQVLANYQQHGKILQTRSKPRTPEKPAEHLIVAVLGTPQFLEAAFARCLLHEGQGLVAVVSHRVYGKAAGPEMSQWLKENGPALEQALMAWDAIPTAARLARLRAS
jgi:hypothetical protein